MRAGRGVLAILLLLLVSALGNGDTSGDLIRLALVGVALVLGFVSWLVTRWRVAEGVLQIETGLIRRTSQRYPLTQIQAVDVVRPGLARILGMAELRLRMAGATGSSGRLAYLATGHAEVLRARLLAAARGGAVQPAVPERRLYEVDPRQLIVSLLISGPAVVVELVMLGLIVLAVVNPSAAAGAVSALFASVVGVAGAVWRRFNGEYRLRVADVPGGLHVQGGLIETSSETIPPGRIQALRLVQPISWRPLGWCRVEVDLAGKATSGRQNRAAAKAGRALLPVGRLEQAAWLVERVMPGVPTDRRPPPARARWKAPLRYPNLSFAVNDGYAVATSGRLRRVTDWVPLEKVQSVRWREGPVQRRLGLANIHLDTAGRTVFAVLRDRDADEADALLSTLPAACRRARAAARSAGSPGSAGSSPDRPLHRAMPSARTPRLR